MKESFPPPYFGHVKDGVVHLDDSMAGAPEGQAVRVEPIISDIAGDRAWRVGELQRRFAEWIEEDGRLSDAQADCLQAALEKSRGLTFRQTAID